jgi:O-acetylserine/cysteine efflux transporter
MPPRHAALAALVAVLWGLAFVATRVGLDSFSPSQLAALRFLVAGVPALALARPPIAWPSLVAVGLALFAGQFLFQFTGIAWGMPAGLAAIVVHTQAFFTVAAASLVLGERPSRPQLAGMALALGGLLAIATTVGQDLTAAGLALGLLSAASWGIGNVLVKRLPRVEMLNLVVWLSLVPPAVALPLSAVLDGPLALLRAAVAAPWRGWAAVAYLGLVATLVAYALWSYLLRLHPAAVVAPFSLLVPFVAAGAAALALGERFGPRRLLGMALVLAGIAIIAWPRPAPSGALPPGSRSPGA